MLLCAKVLQLFEAMDKLDFIDAMGGATIPVGTGSANAEDLACALDDMLRHLTTPGSRVYEPLKNRELFWTTLVTVLKN